MEGTIVQTNNIVKHNAETATDLTVEKAREAAGTVEAFGTQLRADFDKLVADLAPAKVQDRTLAAFAQVQELPTTVAAESKANADKLVARYEDLADLWHAEAFDAAADAAVPEIEKVVTDVMRELQ